MCKDAIKNPKAAKKLNEMKCREGKKDPERRRTEGSGKRHVIVKEKKRKEKITGKHNPISF